MANRFRYSLLELKKAFPDKTEEELLARRSQFTKSLARRGQLARWGSIAGKEIQCQKPKCEGISRRIIDLSDGGFMRYCDTHYDEWNSPKSDAY